MQNRFALTRSSALFRTYWHAPNTRQYCQAQFRPCRCHSYLRPKHLDEQINSGSFREKTHRANILRSAAASARLRLAPNGRATIRLRATRARFRQSDPREPLRSHAQSVTIAGGSTKICVTLPAVTAKDEIGVRVAVQSCQPSGIEFGSIESSDPLITPDIV
jgi:hypothetical protein